MDESGSFKKLAIIGVIVVVVLFLGFGLLFKSGDNSVNNGTSFVSEQQKIMREAMKMAKEAQQMQRQQMELHRREMEMYEGGYAFEEEYNDYNSDW